MTASMNSAATTKGLSVTTIAALAAAIASGATVRAQCSSGPFIATPVAVSFDPSNATFAQHEAYHKNVGIGGGAPGAWNGPAGQPRYDFALAVANCSGWLSPLPDIDSMSVGLDWILADPATGRAIVPNNRWGALTFSVTRGTRGRAGTAIATESAAGTDRVGADIFSFVLDGSAMPAPLVGVTERALDSREIDTGPNPAQIDALDHFMGLFGNEAFVANGFAGPAQWFFTLSSATLGNVHPSVWGNHTPSGATIFVMVENPNGGFSCPRIWMTHADLGLGAGEDIDALAVDLQNQFLLLSTKTRTRNPILFFDYGADFGTLTPYLDPNGTPISDCIGLVGDDDIDAVCAIDPSVRGSQLGLNGIAFAMGTPRPKAFGLPPARIDASAFRVLDPAPNQSRFVTFTKGWPRDIPGLGFAGLFWSLADQPGSSIPILVLPRFPNDPICGNPVSTSVPVPDVPALRGIQVDFRWLLADSNFLNFGEAWPIQVRL